MSPKALCAIVRPLKRDMRHGIPERTGNDQVALGVIDKRIGDFARFRKCTRGTRLSPRVR
jgi:hypothetical protein